MSVLKNNKVEILKLLIVSIILTISYHKLELALLLGPALIAWELTPQNMNKWNRVGISLLVSIIVLVIANIMRISVNHGTGNLAKHQWLILPIILEIIILAKVWKRSIQPWFKLLVIGVVMTIVFGGIENGLLNATYGDYVKEISFISKSMANKRLDAAVLFMRITMFFVLITPIYSLLMFFTNWKYKE